MTENIKNLISTGYDHIKNFVDSNGGIENVTNLFKDDINFVNENHNKFKGCWRRKFFNCHRKERNTNNDDKKDSNDDIIEKFKKKQLIKSLINSLIEQKKDSQINLSENSKKIIRKQ